MFKLQALNPSINSKALSDEHIINRLGYIRCRYPSRINWSRWKVLTKLFNGFILPTGDVRIMRPSPSFPSMGIRFYMNRAVMRTKLKEIMNYKFDGSRVFFTSDTHFNHTNIIRFCNRPFKDVSHMNETNIRKYLRKRRKNVFFGCHESSKHWVYRPLPVISLFPCSGYWWLPNLVYFLKIILSYRSINRPVFPDDLFCHFSE